MTEDMTEEKVQIEVTDVNGLELKVAVPMTEDALLDLVRPMAAEATLLMVRALLDAGVETVNEAFRYGAFGILVQAYGREFVRGEFHLARRTEQRWHSIVRDAVQAMSEEPSAEVTALVKRAAAAYRATRVQERGGHD